MDGQEPDPADPADSSAPAAQGRAASPTANPSAAPEEQKQCSAGPAAANPESQGPAQLRSAQAKQPTPRGAHGTTSGSSRLEATAMIPALKRQQWRSGGAPFPS